MSFIALGTALGATAATAAATGIAAVGTAATVGMGAASMISGGKAQRRSQKALEEQARNSPLYKPSKEIGAYYQEALNRYKESPYQSQQYLIGKQNIQGATAQGISALQDRRSAIGGISRLAGTQSQALTNLGAQVESQKGQRLSQLGQATQMMSGESAKEFDINKMTPYNRRLQLEQMKAQAAGEQYNAGMQMLGSGLSNAASLGISGAFNSPANVNAVPSMSGFDSNVPGSPYGKFKVNTNFNQYWKPTK
jgi:hypothetical protein